MNHYFYSQSQNRTVAVRLNGIKFTSIIGFLVPDYERVPSSARLREMAKLGSIPTYLPQVVQDKTIGYKRLFFTRL